MPANAAQWMWHNIAVNMGAVAREDRQADGTPIVVPSSVAIMPAWADEALAQAWLDEAGRQQLAIAAPRLGTAEVATNIRYIALRAFLQAIMFYYDALDIPWQTHPLARRLYRKYISGWPNPSHPVASEFSPFNDYNQTFTGRSLFMTAPNWQPDEPPAYTENFTGLIPAAARAAFLRYSGLGNAGTDPSQFVHRFLPINVIAYGGDPAYPNVIEAARGIRNDVLSMSTDGTGAGIATATGNVGSDNPARPTNGNFVRVVNEITGRDSALEAWNAVGFDVYPTLVQPERTPFRCTASPASYFQWFNEWYDGLTKQRVADVIVESRVYTTYLNSETFKAVGGSNATFTRILQNELTTNTSNPAVQGEVRVAGQLGLVAATVTGAIVAAGVGAALAPVSLGISALIGGAIVAVTTLAALAVPPDVTNANLRRDDLGRTKPQFQRAWLAGDPSEGTRSAQPEIEIPAPWGDPNFRASGRYKDTVGDAPTGTSITRTTPAVPSVFSQIPTWVWVASGALAVGGIGYGVYRANARR